MFFGNGSVTRGNRMCADKSRLAEWRKLSYYGIEDRASHERSFAPARSGHGIPQAEIQIKIPGQRLSHSTQEHTCRFPWTTWVRYSPRWV